MKKICFSNLSRKNIFILSALFLFTIVSCNTGPKQEKSAVATSDLIAQANELDSLFLAAFNSGDTDAMMKLYWNSPELRIYTPSEMQINGFDAVKASFLKDFAAGKGMKLEYTNANNIPFADCVVGHGTFRITMPVEGGSPMLFDGRYSEVKAIKGDKMVIVLDHASVPMAAPPPEKGSIDSTQKK